MAETETCPTCGGTGSDCATPDAYMGGALEATCGDEWHDDKRARPVRERTEMATTTKPTWPQERPDGSVVWATGTRQLAAPGECDYCDKLREAHGPGGFFPSHDGSPGCYGTPYSIAKVGRERGRAHCTCDGCF